MFESQESTPWYRSLVGLIAASVILPPVGLVLVWMRKNIPLVTKVLATMAIVVLSAAYFYAYNSWRKSGTNEAQFDALEQDRARQKAEAPVDPAAQSAQVALNNRQPFLALLPVSRVRQLLLPTQHQPHTRQKTIGLIFAGQTEMDVTTKWQF